MTETDLSAVEKYFESRHIVRFPNDKSRGEYIAVNKVDPSVAHMKKPRDKDIIAISAIAIDIDYAKDMLNDATIIPTTQQLIEYVEGVRISKDLPKFTTMVHSGHGIHVYLVLYEAPMTDENMRLRNRIMTALIRIFKGDGSARDLSRVLRRPETINKKFGLKAPAKIIDSSGPVYNLSELYNLVIDVIDDEDEVTENIIEGDKKDKELYMEADYYESNLSTLMSTLNVTDGDTKYEEEYGDYPATTRLIINCIFHDDKTPSAFLRLNEDSGQIVFYQCSSDRCGKKLSGLEAHRAVVDKLNIDLKYDKLQAVRGEYEKVKNGNMWDILFIDKKTYKDADGDFKEKVIKKRVFSTTAVPESIIDKRNRKVYLIFTVRGQRTIIPLPGSSSGFSDIPVAQFVIDKYEDTARFFTQSAVEASEPTGWSEENVFISCRNDMLSTQTKNEPNEVYAELLKDYFESDPRIPAIAAIAFSSFLPDGENVIITMKGESTSGKSWFIKILTNHTSYAYHEASSSTANFVRETLTTPYQIVAVDEAKDEDDLKGRNLFSSLYKDIFGGVSKGRLKRSGLKQFQPKFTHITFIAASENISSSGSEGMVNRINVFDMSGMRESYEAKVGEEEALKRARVLYLNKSDTLDMFDEMEAAKVEEYAQEAMKCIKNISIVNVRDKIYATGAITALLMIKDKLALSNFQEALNIILKKIVGRVTGAKMTVFERIMSKMHGYVKIEEHKKNLKKSTVTIVDKVFYRNDAWAYRFSDGSFGFTKTNLEAFLQLTDGGNINIVKKYAKIDKIKLAHARIQRIIVDDNAFELDEQDQRKIANSTIIKDGIIIEVNKKEEEYSEDEIEERPDDFYEN